MLQTTSLSSTLWPRSVYWFLFALLGLVYIPGLFVPLMDNDSAHHANIALHMYLTRDYVSLVDAGKDYLDKPHLLFWLCALSYKIFGVTTFAYKFPSFCFTIAGTYAVWRLGRSLYNAETGRLAALIIASAFAYALANNDVRMDAILVACIALACWQGVDFVQTQKVSNAAWFGVALGLGFCTKGHIALVCPVAGVFFYILSRRSPRLLLNWKWLITIIVFSAVISPVVYCYYLQFNRHPEKVVRGADHINGVRFILFGQSVERFNGQAFGGDSKKDYFFFFHTFLWAFAPWSIVGYVAVVSKIKMLKRERSEWFTLSNFFVVALLITIAGFKLPHYLNIVFPAMAVLTASWLLKRSPDQRVVLWVQLTVCCLLLLVAAVVNTWAFPATNGWLIAGCILLLSIAFYFLLTKNFLPLQKAIAIPAASMALLLFLLNANFYPRLLTYQGGRQLAGKTKANLDAANVYFWKDNYSSSFNFYTATQRRQFADSIVEKGGKPVWLLFDIHARDSIITAGYRLGAEYCVPDFEITRLNGKFINPSTRQAQLTQVCVAEITSGRP